MTTDQIHPNQPAGGARKPARRGTTGQAVALVVGVLVTAFALLNLDKVKVNWILGTWQTPLILVIVVSFALGLAAGMVLHSRRLKAKARR